MARSAKSTAVTKKSTGTAVALIDDQLTAEANALAKQIGAPSGNKLKVDVTGKFVTPDGLDLGSEIQVVVVDFISRNFFYSTAYSPGEITPPDCYSMGKDVQAMKPEDDSPMKQHDACATCPMNAFGSGQGNAKACQNRYWVSVLLVDPDNPEAHNDPAAPIYLLDLSPSNRKSFEGAIRSTTKMLGHWAKAMYTVIAENAGTFARVSWVDPVPNPDYAAHVARRPEVEDVLLRRPDFSAAAAAPSRSRAPARRANKR